MSHIARSLAPFAIAAAFALPAAAQEITLKVHHFWAPTAMPPSTLLVPWCDKIAKDSGGKLKCQIYPAMQLGGAPPQLIQQAMDGVADIVWTLPGYTAGRFPLMEVFELPFMSSSAEVIEVADHRPKRDFLYVSDLVKLLLITLERGSTGIYNAGSGESASIQEIAEIIGDFVPRRKPVVSLGECRPQEILDVVADIGKAGAELGWRPAVPLRAGLQALVESRAAAQAKS
jgi:hypothetical protein